MRWFKWLTRQMQRRIRLQGREMQRRFRPLIVEQYEERRVLAAAVSDDFTTQVNQPLTVNGYGTWANDTYNPSWEGTYWEPQHIWHEGYNEYIEHEGYTEEPVCYDCIWENGAWQTGYWEQPVWHDEYYDEFNELQPGYYAPPEPVWHEVGYWAPPAPVWHEPWTETIWHNPWWEGAWLPTTINASGGITSSPANGSLTQIDSGYGQLGLAFIYTPNSGFVGTDGFSYSLTDDAGTSTASVTITVNPPPNTPPVANDDYYTVAVDAVLSAGVLGNDYDPNGDPLTASLASGPSSGTLALGSDGSFTYTPDPNTSNNADAFTYTVSDGIDSASATAHITIYHAYPPVATDDTYVVEPGATLTIAAAGVLANDTDPNGDSLTASLLSGPSSGTLAFNSDGSFTYTPNANFHGSDAFTYSASDGSLTDSATVTIKVNTAPVVTNDAYYVNEDTILNIAAAGVLANDTDADGDSLSASLVSGPANGTLTLNADGSLTYMPSANFNGADTFTYVSSDWAATSNVAIVIVTVNPVNDAPVSSADALSATENTVLTIDMASILTNDSDPENDPLTVTVVAGPSHGTLSLELNGSALYIPGSNYSGADAFTYQASDGSLVSAAATVTVTVNSFNNVLVASNFTLSTPKNTAATINLLGAVINGVADGPGPINGSWTQLGNGAILPTGTMLLQTNGDVMVQGFGFSKAWSKLSPDPNGSYINGVWSSLASMGLERLFYGSNILPSGKLFLLGGEYTGPGGDETRIGSGEVYDPGSNTWQAIRHFPQEQFGDAPTVLLPNGQIVAGYHAAEDKRYNQSPLPNDGNLLLNNPYANYDILEYFPNDDFWISGATYLYNPAADPAINPAADPASNPWSRTGTKLRFEKSSEDNWALLPDGSVLSYDMFASVDKPNLDGSGYAQRYVPSLGKWVDTGSVPVPLSSATAPGQAYFYELGPGFLLPNGDLFQIGGAPSGSGNRTNTALYNLTFNTWTAGPQIPLVGYTADDAPGAVLPNGNVIFAADTTGFQPPTKLFEYDPEANSGTGGIAEMVVPSGLSADLISSPAYRTRMLVLPTGQILVGTGASQHLWVYTPPGTADSAWRPTISGIVSNPDGSYTLTGTQLNGLSEGAAYGDDAEMSSNYPIVQLTNTSGQISFARTFDWTPGVATGAKQVSTKVALPAGFPAGQYTLRVIANGIASAPVDFNASRSLAFSLANIIAHPQHGTLSGNANGSFTYVPQSTFSGVDSFTYRAISGSDVSNTATVSITVDAPPTANSDSYTVGEYQTLHVTTPGGLGSGILANDTDLDSSSLNALIVTGPAHGDLALNADGSFSYRGGFDYYGTDSFTYKATDGTFNSNVATVTLNITPATPFPVANDDSFSVLEDAVLNVTYFGTVGQGVLANDTDAAGVNDLLVVNYVDRVTDTMHGALNLSHLGVNYTPLTDYFGSDSFSYNIAYFRRLHTGFQWSNVATASITVLPVNDQPSFTKGSDKAVDEDAGPQSFANWATGLSAGPANEAVQTLTFLVTNNTNPGLFSVQPQIAPDGTLSFTSAPDANGTATITVTLQDSGGTDNGGQDTSAAQTFTIAVNSVNDPPVASADGYVTDDDTPLNVLVPGILTNDSDIEGDALTAVLSSGPANGTLTLNANGSFTYTPSTNYNGSDSFTYRASDGQATSNLATVTLTVNSVNDPPTATINLSGFSVAEQVLTNLQGTDSQGIPRLRINDVDAGDSTIKVSVQVLYGALYFDDGTLPGLTASYSYPGLYSIVELWGSQARINAFLEGIPGAGSLNYDSNSDARTWDTLWLIVFDQGNSGSGGPLSGGDSDLLIITPVNDAPSFTKGPDLTVTDEHTVQAINGWATDLSAGPANESGQTLVFQVTNSNNSLFSVQPAIDATGKLTYTPAPNVRGTATVTVVLRDDGGTANGGIDASPAQTFTITVDKPHPWYNAKGKDNPNSLLHLDIDDDEQIDREDVRLVIAFINADPFKQIDPATDDIGPMFFDTDGDNYVSPHDAVLVINYINSFLQNPWHNYVNPVDVDADGSVSTIDAVLIINYVNYYEYYGYSLEIPENPNPGPDFLDVNKDWQVTRADASLVIDYLNNYNKRWHNWVPDFALDVNADGGITNADYTIVVDWLDEFGAGPVPASAASDPVFFFLDVDGDNDVDDDDEDILWNHFN